ncbi:DegT/DnrJ/EryC1/StrS family aminotransferase [Blautia sp. MSJ-9]|uniref:DegT/DnrJ/EryC1/StrS family aminotransferase n=1 Tax=Blautia sp. MSJ-9 TaxID=2841511 RepID=UPI001C11DBC0|nr:DegT/DnrJ/EryC1/StrS family aminotransferase [Blautia sp. MSJ-9]MBU5680974.1 DegT/DnrJ/EryC1/StrS family aminotransferase [Blautia sp. MSJ-9]
MEFKLCDSPWDNEEIEAIQSVIDSDMYTMGKNVAEYERQFAEHFGAKYAVQVNSGSTANLLAIAALVYSGKLDRGSEVIVPAVSWSTTYAPLEQFGMKLIFVDIDRYTLNLDINSVKNAITDKTKMVFAVNLLGNSNEYDKLLKICSEKGIILIEDNCESLGATYKGKYLGTIGLLGTYSTFYSHHMCTMEGGVVVTDDRELYEYMLAIRAHGWTRNLPTNSKIYEKKEDSFYESFNFIVPGFNIRPLEMEGAIGIKQLKKIDKMIDIRRSNAEYFLKKMKKYDDIRVQKEVGESSWFGFAMILTGKLFDKRGSLVEKLRKANIECRPIVAGNFTRNPVIKYMDYRIPSPLTNADEIHEQGLFIGNHSSNNNEQVDYFIEILDSFLLNNL